MQRGNAASELLRYATDVSADLVAVGAHGLGFIARMIVGSIATKILRTATSAVLMVPGP
jgi:nucleotide-binding universal stress UspA family protein